MTNEILYSTLFYGSIALVTAILAELSTRAVVKAEISSIPSDIFSRRLRFFLAFLAVFVPSLFAGLRYGIGTDYGNYLRIFDRISAGLTQNSTTDPLYLLINRVAVELGLGFQSVLFLSSFITNLFIYLALRKYRSKISVGLGMFVYMLMYYQISFNIIRQIAAMAIILYSIDYIGKRKPFKFTAVSAMSLGFHKTGAVFYPFYFLYPIYSERKYRNMRILSFIIVAFVMMNFSAILYPIFSRVGPLSRYAESYLRTDRSFELRVGLFVRTLPLLIPCFLVWRAFKKDKNMMFLFNMLFLGCIFLLTAYSSVNYTERIAHYFMCTQVIVIPFIYRESIRYKRRFVGVLSVLAIVMLWWWDFIYVGRNATIPYEWIISTLR